MLYQASPIKRTRKAELESRKNSLFEIVSEIHPCTVRQCFYQAEARFSGNNRADPMRQFSTPRSHYPAYPIQPTCGKRRGCITAARVSCFFL
jgi:hypothetical protein